MFLSSAGHVADMIARMKNNRALRKKTGYFHKDDPIVLKEKHQSLAFKKVSREAKKHFLLKIKEEHRKELVKSRFLLILYILIFVAVFSWFLVAFT